MTSFISDGEHYVEVTAASVIQSLVDVSAPFRKGVFY